MNLKCCAMFLMAGALVFGETDSDKRLKSAAEAFQDVMGIPDKSIPQELLNKAYCVIIVPNLKKGAFVFGAQYGKGFVTCRKKDNVGWTSTGAIRIEGGSFGLQIGGTETDVFMLVTNQRGMDRLLSSKFTIGGDATAAAGPVGRSTQAETDAALTAEILTWSRARGLFAGISLKGSTLRPDDDDNKELYGKNITNREILTGDVAPPASAQPLLDDLNRYSSRK
jgi:SH3 domain-containing YSC84-like protein 1